MSQVAFGQEKTANDMLARIAYEELAAAELQCPIMSEAHTRTAKAYARLLAKYGAR